MTASEQNRPHADQSILLAVGQTDDRAALRAMLQGLGDPLVEARSGDEARARLQEADFAVVLVDVQIPGLPAEEVVRWLRSQPRSRHTPVILISNQMTNGPPEIVFSDISMPGMTGYDLAQHIRRDRNGREMFLVAMTGYGQPEDRERALAAGFDEHLVKPVEMNRLQDVFAAAAHR